MSRQHHHCDAVLCSGLNENAESTADSQKTVLSQKTYLEQVATNTAEWHQTGAQCIYDMGQRTKAN